MGLGLGLEPEPGMAAAASGQVTVLSPMDGAVPGWGTCPTHGGCSTWAAWAGCTALPRQKAAAPGATGPSSTALSLAPITASTGGVLSWCQAWRRGEDGEVERGALAQGSHVWREAWPGILLHLL